MVNWKEWIGLPHQIGADPRDGEAACCLVMSKILLEDAGITFPVEIKDILDLVDQRLWHSLKLLFEKKTQSIDEPEPLAVSLVNNPTGGLGIGVVVEEAGILYLLLPHHRKGVQAYPVSVLRSGFTFFRAKQ